MSRKPTKAPKAPKVDIPTEPTYWFPGPDDEVVIPLVGKHSMTIRTELDAGTQVGLLDGLSTTNLQSALEAYTLRKAFAYLVSWTLPIELPTSEEGWQALVNPDEDSQEKSLGRSRFLVIDKAIDAYEKKLPKPTPIVPVVLEASDDWFFSPTDTVTLALPHSESITVRADLPAGAKAKLIAGLEGERTRATSLQLALATAAAYITKWTLKYPDGRPVPVGLDSLREMLNSKWSIVNRTIQAYEEALEARAENPTGSGGLSSPSASAN
jgi:hypothetical protein